MNSNHAEDIVFVGDVHLGRRPVGLDEALGEHFPDLTARDLSPAEALRLLVDGLCRRPPRAVVFAGDLVDQERDRFEAFAVLESEVGRLAKAGIPVFAIAGNHDGLVLPRLVDRVDGVRLLGEGGVWERVELPGQGHTVDLLGWSFSSSSHRGCPLDHESFRRVRESLRPDAVHLGVLHADLDAAGSRYAPVPRARLEAAGLHAWLLGHVHAPHALTGERPIGYLGSLVGLDGGEPGPRGAWRVTVGTGGVSCEQLPGPPVRFEDITVELQDGCAGDLDAVHERVRQTLIRWAAEHDLGEIADLRLLVACVRLTGRLADRAAPRELVERCEQQRLVFPEVSPPVVVRRVEDRTRPAIDLETLAGESTPIGHVAKQILALREGRAGPLLTKAEQEIERIRSGGFEVDDETYPLPSHGELLERAAWRLLDTLLLQRGEREEANS